jgi:uncharacterized protein (TIGR02284 family)
VPHLADISLSSRAVCAVMNRLILACKDDARAQDAAATIVHGQGAREHLRECADERRAFVRELGAIVHERGGTARTNGSASAGVFELFRFGRAAVIGTNDGDTYGMCARVEARTAEAYAEALLLELPAVVRAVVERQQVEIQRDSAELRRKSFLQ